MRLAGPRLGWAAVSPLSAVARAGRAAALGSWPAAAGAVRAAIGVGDVAVRAGRAAGGNAVAAASSVPAPAFAGTFLLPARFVNGLASTAAAAVSTATQDAGAAAARIGESLAAIGDIGAGRTRRRVWSRMGRAHVEVRGLTGRGPEHRRLAGEVTSALARLKGVQAAELNAAMGEVVVAFDEDEADVAQLVAAVEEVERAHGTDTEDFPWAPGPHPADGAPAAVAATALAMDCLGMVSAVTGRMARLGTPPRAVRAAVSLVDANPRLRQALAERLGPPGADLVLAAANALTHGLTQGEGPLAVDAMHRLLAIGELRAHRAVWERRELELHSTGHPLPAECPEAVPRPAPLPPGPVEKAADITSVGSLLSAGGVLAWTGDPGRAADVVLATVPKAARLGREGFAAMLGRELAGRGIVALDATALRRLDRVTAVVVDSAVLGSAHLQVLSAASLSRRCSDAEVWQRAEQVLRGRDAEDLQRRGPWVSGGWRLRRTPGTAHARSSSRDGPRGPAAMALELVDAGGRRRGRVEVGLQLDPLAEIILSACREAAGRVLLTEHASVTDVVSWADEVLPASVPLAEHVRRLQQQGHGVLTVSAGDDQALDVADVGVAVITGTGGVCWLADLVCGPGLGELWRVLQAVAVARQVSDRSARLSAGGSALGALLVSVGTGPGRGRGGLVPVHSTALATLVSGAASGFRAARRAEPEPVPRGPWHALTAEDAFDRLRAAGPRPGDESTPERRNGPRDSTAPASAARSRIISSTAAASARGGLEFARLVRGELRDPLTPVLAFGAVASAVVGSAVDAALVSGVMAGNALISGAERMRAERALRQLLLGEKALARRVRWIPPARNGGGQRGRSGGSDHTTASGSPPAGADSFRGMTDAPAETVPAGDLAVGDIITLRSSDVVPADARLLLAAGLEVDESTLTGESIPVAKSTDPALGAALAERTCMIYEGTSVLAGTAFAVVTATGSATEAGRAARIAGRAAPPAGLQARLAELTRIALPATGAGGLAVTGLGLLRGVPLRAAVTSGVAVAVAAVPEGLPLVATVSELAAARRLSRRGVLVRSARALEALGRVDIVCFDKTGTLTQGRLAVARLAVPGRDVPLDSPPGRRLLRVAARACPTSADTGTTRALTHATDRAVVAAASTYAGADEAWRPVEELPFEASRGYSASLGEQSGRLRLAVKGVPEVVLARCTSIDLTLAGHAPGKEGDVSMDQEVLPLTAARRRSARAAVDALAADGLRVLAVAETARPDLAEEYQRAHGAVAGLAGRLTLLGFVAIADPPRSSARAAVRRLAELGIQTVMITGDHPATGAAVAGQAGIPAGQVLTGGELNRLPEHERTARIAASTVIARTSPEQKVQIIRSLQQAGHVVAMTGDGTNDAAAIRVADVGIGVSARGSRSARGSADLILTDSDPARIPGAVLEGRALWAAVRDAVSILVGGNAGEVSFTLLGTALSGRAPLNTRQLLLVNLLTDMLPALAVALAPARPAGSEPPATTGPVGPFLRSGLAQDIAVRGGATTLGATAAWQAGRMTGRRKRADTMGLAAVVLTELGQTLHANWRSPLVITTSAVSAMALGVIVETPGVSQFFGCTPLGPAAWTMTAASSAGATLAAAIAPRFVPPSLADDDR